MRAWFYKDGVGKIFEDGVCPEGWTDHPDGWSKDIIAAQKEKDAPKEKKAEKPVVKKVARKKRAVISK